MLFNFAAWIVITIVSFVWGEIICGLFSFTPSEKERSLPLKCLIGMNVIGVLGYYFSLAGPLHWYFRILFFAIPVLLLIVFPRIRAALTSGTRQLFSQGTTTGYAMTVSCVLVALLLSASPVIHPDTLNYHQFSVRIFHDYGSIVGVVNARADLGFQSSWFAALNVFDPRGMVAGVSFPLGGAVMGWFILFLRPALAKGQAFPADRRGWFALGLLIFTMASWTQIRLTAASASPDFLAALAVMAAFYFFAANQQQERGRNLLAAFFAFSAVLTKLSAFPVLLIPGLICLERIRGSRDRTLPVVTMMGLLMLIPLLIRSYLESGYLLFPSAAPDVFHADWKMLPDQAMLSQEYIRAYARYPLSSVETYRFLGLPFSAWSVIWWRHLYVIDKLLLVLVAGGFLSTLVFFRRVRRRLSARGKKALLVSMGGIVFWFVFGPDPRFGTGFLLSFLALALSPFFSDPGRPGAEWAQWMYRIPEAGLLLAVSGYFIYRLIFFTVPGEWKRPIGVVNGPVAHPDCTDQVKKLIFPDLPYGDALPDSCVRFRLRGVKVSEGFAPLH